MERKGRLVSLETLRKHLNQQPRHKLSILAVTDTETGETEYLEVSQTGDQPPIVQRSSENNLEGVNSNDVSNK